MLSNADLAAFWITVKLAGITTLILLVLGTPLAWWLARTRFRGKVVVEALVALPLVLPPTVLGFYLLLTLGPRGPVGRFMAAMGGQALAFAFSANDPPFPSDVAILASTSAKRIFFSSVPI